MSKPQPIETMPKEGEFLAKTARSGIWHHVERMGRPDIHGKDSVINKLKGEA